MIFPGVAGDANALGPPGTPDLLRQWVAQYMTQVGLAVVAGPPSADVVELRLSLSARGGSVLLYGTAGMALLASGRTLDQLTTSEHVEPAGGFARALARDLVEALVHSQPLAAHVDGTTDRAPPPPRNGTVIPAVALSGPPPPPPSNGFLAPEGPGSGPGPGSPNPALPPPAPGPGADNTAAAKAHARQGLAHYDLGHLQQAYAEFEQAYLLEQDPALLYNMGQCQRKLGNNDEALHFYRTYLRRVPKGPSAVEAEKHVRELEDAAARPHK